MPKNALFIVRKIVFAVLFSGLIGWPSLGQAASSPLAQSASPIEGRHIGFYWSPNALKLDVWFLPRWGGSVGLQYDSYQLPSAMQFSGSMRWRAATGQQTTFGSPTLFFATAQVTGGFFFPTIEPGFGITAAATANVGLQSLFLVWSILEGRIDGLLQFVPESHARLGFSLTSSFLFGYKYVWLGFRGGVGYWLSTPPVEQPAFALIEVFLIFRFEPFFSLVKKTK